MNLYNFAQWNIENGYSVENFIKLADETDTKKLYAIWNEAVDNWEKVLKNI